MNSLVLSLTVQCTRWWVRVYTAGLPTDRRDSRRAEIDSDIWEQQHYAETAGLNRDYIALLVLERLFLGIPTDLVWRASLWGVEVNEMQEDQNLIDKSDNTALARTAKAVVVGATLALSLAALVIVAVSLDSEGSVGQPITTAKSEPSPGAASVLEDAGELRKAASDQPQPAARVGEPDARSTRAYETHNLPFASRLPFWNGGELTSGRRYAENAQTTGLVKVGSRLECTCRYISNPPRLVVGGADCRGSEPDLLDIYAALVSLETPKRADTAEDLARLDELLLEGAELPRSSLRRWEINAEVSNLIVADPATLESGLRAVPGRQFTVKCDPSIVIQYLP